MILGKIIKYSCIEIKDEILFFASGSIPIPCLKIITTNFNNVKIITHKNQRSIITNKVQIMCRNQRIPYLTPITSKNNRNLIQQQWEQFICSIGNPTFGIVFSFGYMIPTALIRKFSKGMIVIHPSLLPKYKGGAPIYHTIINAQKQSGISYIQISENIFDYGNILYQIQCCLTTHETYEQLEQKLSQLASNNILYVLKNINQLRPGKKQQNNNNKNYDAPIIKNKYLNLNLNANEIYHYSRAIKNPILYLDGKIIIFKFLFLFLEKYQNDSIGQFRIINKKLLFVKCFDKHIRITHWKQPNRQLLHIGLFIARFLKCKPEQQWPLLH